MTLTNKQVREMIIKGEKLPENLIVEALCLVDLDYPIELPDGLTINGSFNAYNDSDRIKKLPRRLTVNGVVFFTDVDVISFIPCDAKIRSVYLAGGTGYISVKEFNRLGQKQKRLYFLREKIITLQKLIEIPELYQEVYYSRKSEFMELLKKL